VRPPEGIAQVATGARIPRGTLAIVNMRGFEGLDGPTIAISLVA
jgi:hypothetical protein